jgi:hypothetical protein
LEVSQVKDGHSLDILNGPKKLNANQVVVLVVSERRGDLCLEEIECEISRIFKPEKGLQHGVAFVGKIHSGKKKIPAFGVYYFQDQLPLTFIAKGFIRVGKLGN